MIGCALNILLERTGLLLGEAADENSVILYINGSAGCKPHSFAWEHELGFSGPVVHVDSFHVIKEKLRSMLRARNTIGKRDVLCLLEFAVFRKLPICRSRLQH